MKKFFLMMLLAVVSLAVMAQDRKVEGILIDRDTQEAVQMATVQLLKTDSTYISGVLTDENGLFVLQAPANGKYLLKITNVGYATQVKKIEIAEDHDLNMGKIVFGSDAIMLQGVTATALAKKVVVVEDTFVYNSAAYKTPEGSAVEELIRLIPGAQIDDEGNVTINGKTVKKIKMDGKEFMNGDTKTALKNLPTAIVERVKAYEGKSDRSRITGIEDGEDEMTLDFGIKAGMNKGMLGNIDLGYGTHDRYAERMMAGLFKDDLKMMGFGNFNNVNDMGFGGRGGGFGRNRNGLNTSNMVGVNFNYEKTGLLKWDGSVRWNHGTSNQYTKNSSESFVLDNRSFSNSLAQNYSKNKSWNANMRFEWTPDTMTNIMFRPSFSWSDNDGRGGSVNATFDKDPFENTGNKYTVEQMDEIVEAMRLLGLAKNEKYGSSLSYGETKNVNGWLQFNRRLNNSGRNLSFNLSGGFSSSKSNSFSTQNVQLFQVADKDYSINRYNVTPSKNWNYSAQASYSEPIAKKTYLQFSYKFAQSYSKSDRSTYDLSDFSELPADYAHLLASLGINNIPEYRQWDKYVISNYEDYYDESVSRFSEYKNITHDIEVQFRRVRDNYNFNFGVMAQPQHQNFVQHYLGNVTDRARNIFNFTPTADFRYYFTKQHQLRFNYRGRTTQPSMEQMVEITDNSDPMNITVGNPNLKPSFNNNFGFFYNNYMTDHSRNILFGGGYNNTRNKTVSSVKYNAETGGQTRTYENIDGNWSTFLWGEYSQSIDSIGHWYVTVHPDYSFNNNVGLVVPERGMESVKSITRQHNIGDRLQGSYRNSWLNIDVDGNVNYSYSYNDINPDAKLNTWSFSYGGSMQITLPWGMQLSTDLHNRSRRGYNDASLNTNELIWNAQIAQSFLRGKNLTVMLQFYDILKNQSNLTRTVNEMMRRDSEYNSINSYAMLRVSYRFQMMGGKAAREQMGPPGGPGGRPDFSRPEFRTRGGGPGGFPGGGHGGFGGPR